MKLLASSLAVVAVALALGRGAAAQEAVASGPAIDRPAIVADQRAILARAGVVPLERREAAEALGAEGVKLHDQARFEEALAKYAAALEQDPTAWRALSEISLTRGARGELDKALEAIVRAQVIAPKVADLAAHEAQVLDDLGFPERALEAYERALELDPRNFEALLNRGITRIRLHQFAESGRDLVAAGEVRPRSPSPWWHLAKLHRAQNDVAGEKAALERFLRIDPQDPRAGKASERLAELAGPYVAPPEAVTFAGHPTVPKADTDARIAPRDIAGLMVRAMEASPRTYEVGCAPDDAARWMAAEAALWKDEVQLTGDDRIDCKTELDRLGGIIGMADSRDAARALRCVRPGDPEWSRVNSLLGSINLEARWTGLPPPATLPADGKKVGVCFGGQAHDEWLGYFVGRAALRHELELRARFGLPADGRRSVEEEFLSLVALTGRPSDEELAASGAARNAAPAPDAVLARLDEIARAGLLRAYVIAEILPSRGVAISALDENDARLVDRYLTIFVLEPRVHE